VTNSLITFTQAAQRTGHNPSTLRYAADRGHLRATKYGKTWLVEETELMRWLNTPEYHKTGKKP